MAKFDTGLFAMANAIKDTAEDVTDHAWRQNANYVMSTGEHLEVDQNAQVHLLYTPVADSIYIPGMEATDESTIPAGKYKVDVATKSIIFSGDDNLTYVDVVYDYIQEVTEAIVTNKESAIGEAVAIWPVYGSGDDCSESSIIGYYIVKVFRARITQIPGINETSSPCVQQCTYKNFPNTEKLLAA